MYLTLPELCRVACANSGRASPVGTGRPVRNNPSARCRIERTECRDHPEDTPEQVTRHGDLGHLEDAGREVGNRGDSFVGIFNSPSRAIRCASAIADTIAPLGISLRSGIHAGEVHLTGGEISGIAVHIAARIAAAAHPGEACVSRTVRDLVVGSGLVFEDRGIHRLRGLPEEIHLYAMRSLMHQ